MTSTRDDFDMETGTAALPPWREALIDCVIQVSILIISAAAMYLIAQPQPLMGWGFVVGLASQPLWFLATWRARQWGMFALSIFYTGAWATGIANHFH